MRIHLLALLALVPLAACGMPMGGSTAADCETTIRCAGDRDCPSGTYCDQLIHGGVCLAVHCAAAGVPCTSDSVCAAGVCDGHFATCVDAPIDLGLYDACGAVAEGTACSTVVPAGPHELPLCHATGGAPSAGGSVCSVFCVNDYDCPGAADGVPGVCADVGNLQPIGQTLVFCLRGCPDGVCPMGFQCQQVPGAPGVRTRTEPACVPDA